jgi:uncharacterized SAM-binding protein YcdF (DUF218 family)
MAVRTRGGPSRSKPEPVRGPVRTTARGVGKMGRGVGRAGRGAATGTVGAVRYVRSLREPESRRRLYWRLLLLVVVTMVGYVAVTFAQVWWISRQDGAREADAAVVLGAAQYDGRPSAVLQGRLDHALELYEDELVRTIVVTGGRQEGDRYTEAQAGYLYLRDHGVPDEAILLEDQGTSTWESLAASARILRDRDLTRAVLVTDGYHALRVRAIADELGLDASVSPTRRGGTVTELARETGAVAVGRILGFRRLVDIDDHLMPSSSSSSSGSGSSGDG